MKNESDVVDDMIRAAYRRRESRIASGVDVDANLDSIYRRASGRLRVLERISVLGARRPLTALAAGFLLVFVLIGGVVLLGVGFDLVYGNPDVGGSPSAGSTLPAVATSQVSGTQVTDDDIPADWSDGTYRVDPGAERSTVPVLGEPSASSPTLGALTKGDGVVLTGESATVDAVTYYQVVWGGADGWIDAQYVAPPDAWRTGFEALGCEPDGAAFETADAVMPASNGPHEGPAAGHVLDVVYHESEDCERLVVVLGASLGVDGEGWWLGVPAAWVPEGATVRSGTSVVSVTVPGVADVRPLASTLVFEDVLGLASRSVDGVVLDFVFESNRRAAVQILENPARVVIDLRPDLSGTGLDLAPSRGGAFVLMPVDVDVEGPGVDLPVTITGWGRPLESTAVAELRVAASEAGTGDLVEALFDTASMGSQRTSRYVFATADWVLWSPFSLTIEDLAPGEYELFVGENTPSETESGVYLRFTVAG